MNGLSTTGLFYTICVALCVVICGSLYIGTKIGGDLAETDLMIQAEEIAALDGENETLKQELSYYRTLFSLMECESSFRHRLPDGSILCADKGKSCGGLMFQQPTYKMLAARSSYVGGDWLNLKDQLVVALEAIRRGEHTRHWTCA